MLTKRKQRNKPTVDSPENCRTYKELKHSGAAATNSAYYSGGRQASQSYRKNFIPSGTAPQTS